jgi:hypothetical protein
VKDEIIFLIVFTLIGSALGLSYCERAEKQRCYDKTRNRDCLK